MNIDLLKRLCEIPGIPGREERVRAAIEEEIDGLFDEMEVDPLGSLICRRNATRKTRGRKSAGTVLIAAHMDEIGFYIRHVDEHGFLWVNAEMPRKVGHDKHQITELFSHFFLG